MSAKLVNRIMLGLVMAIPGLIKLAVIGPAAVSGMLGSFGFPIPMVFAWILILSEIVFGLAILMNWKVEYTAWPPLVILVVAVLVTTPWTQPSNIQAPSVLLHLAVASNYWLLSRMARHTSTTHKR